MRRERDAARTYNAIRREYRYDGSIMSEEDPRCRAVKWIIENRLDGVEQAMLLLYVDCLSFRKLGKRLGVSHTTIRKEIMKIKNKILEEYGKLP